MWSTIWTVVGIVVLVGVALLFIVDALQERTVPARIAALLFLVGGVLFGLELWTPWVPISVLAIAFCLGIAGRLGSNREDKSTRSGAEPAS